MCHGCVRLLDVDGASISVIDGGQMHGTFGSGRGLSRTLDELHFTFGEGPCLDAVAHGRAVLLADLDDAREQRWPAFTGAFLEHGVRAARPLPDLMTAGVDWQAAGDGAVRRHAGGAPEAASRRCAARRTGRRR